MPLNRWRLAPYIACIVAATAVGGWYAGVIGAALGAVVTLGVSSMSVVHDLIRESR
jgi:hypothetical protein